MKEQVRLPLLLILSLLFHVGLLYIIPVFELPPLVKEDIYEVKLIKPKPVQTAATKKKTTDQKTKTEPEKKVPVKKKEIDYAGMKRPDMALPTITTDERIDIPDVDLSADDLKNGKQKDVTPESDVNKELASAEKSFDQYNEDVSKKGIQSAQYGDSSFYELKNISGKNRSIFSTPPKPKFSLENNTKIVLQFKVDRFGTVSNIVPLTGADSKVLKIAYDWVNGIRFNAIDNDSSDSVEITLYFKVK